jgi:intracellular multiplication protein IcmC
MREFDLSNKFNKALITGVLLFFTPSLVLATSSFSLDTALNNITQSFSNIQSLIYATTYVIGVGLVVKGLMMAKIFGSQTMASTQRGELAGILIHIFIGALLIYVPSTLDTSLVTVFGTGTAGVKGYNDLLAYQSLSGSEQWTALSQIALKYLTLIGMIAFVRGWLLLAKLGHSGSQPGGLGKGLMHVIGGVLLINGVETFNILARTLGYSGS